MPARSSFIASTRPIASRPPLTRALIHAAAMDAAKASMRRAGRAAMNEEDADRFHAVFDALFQRVGGPEGWLQLERD